jgi:hypothetical protein
VLRRMSYRNAIGRAGCSSWPILNPGLASATGQRSLTCLNAALSAVDRGSYGLYSLGLWTAGSRGIIYMTDGQTMPNAGAGLQVPDDLFILDGFGDDYSLLLPNDTPVLATGTGMVR